jgi:hypothetical protein
LFGRQQRQLQPGQSNIALHVAGTIAAGGIVEDCLEILADGQTRQPAFGSGYKHFFIQPLPGGPLTTAAATLETPFGTARSAWQLDGETLRLTATVPPNTTATVRLPLGPNGPPVISRASQPLAPTVAGRHVLLDLAPGHHELAVTGR